GGRPRASEHVVGGVEVVAARRSQRVRVRRGDADRGRPADREVADRVGDLGGAATLELDLLERKAALVENDDPAGLEPDDRLGLEHPSWLGRYVPSSHDARYFACSSVSWSIATPIVSSLSFAIASSISVGTG